MLICRKRWQLSCLNGKTKYIPTELNEKYEVELTVKQNE